MPVVLANALAAVAEEAWFRRVCFGLLAPAGPVVAIAGSTVLFAAVHVAIYGFWVVPVDLAAGALLGWQRAVTGSWTVPAATHVIANLSRDPVMRPVMRRRPVLVGMTVVAIYVVAVSVDGRVAPRPRAPALRRVRSAVVVPVRRPTRVLRVRATSKPTATSATIALGASGSVPAGLATPDGQFVVNLGRGAIPPAKGATAISMRITPIAPKDLAPVPRRCAPTGMRTGSR